MTPVQLIAEQVDANEIAFLASRWQLTVDPLSPLALVLTPERLELRKLDEPKLGAIYVDFLSATLNYRRTHGGGLAEPIAKAIGVKHNYFPTVFDATAGLGREAFLLSSLGCCVNMVERHPVVAALLDDGIRRGYHSSDIALWLQERLTLSHASSIDILQHASPDVVYLDPMFPHRHKSAMVKKEMRIFQLLVGSDNDSEQLLSVALMRAEKRVVVKRPSYAQPLASKKPQFTIMMKKHRFDIYLPVKHV